MPILYLLIWSVHNVSLLNICSWFQAKSVIPSLVSGGEKLVGGISHQPKPEPSQLFERLQADKAATDKVGVFTLDENSTRNAGVTFIVNPIPEKLLQWVSVMRRHIPSLSSRFQETREVHYTAESLLSLLDHTDRHDLTDLQRQGIEQLLDEVKDLLDRVLGPPVEQRESQLISGRVMSGVQRQVDMTHQQRQSFKALRELGMILEDGIEELGIQSQVEAEIAHRKEHNPIHQTNYNII